MAKIGYFAILLVKMGILNFFEKSISDKKNLKERKKERTFLLPGMRNGRVPYFKKGTQAGTRSTFGQGTRK